MLYLIQSNQLESLADRLRVVLAEPLPDPFAPETVVVQNAGMGRWLSQQIALKSGIAANIQFPLPARFIWQVFDGQLDVTERQSDFDRQVLLWRVQGLLADLAGEPAFAQIKDYLRDDRDGLKAFHLAGKITDLFDQYLVYRPDMLLKWEGGQEPEWQPILWRKLTAEGGEHRARLLSRLQDKFRTGGLDPDPLPPRFCVFGISSLAPIYMEILHGISTVTDVYLFHLSPCRQYWGDLASDSEMAKRRRAWRRKEQADVSSYFEAGNPLLASLGQVGREFAQQLSGLEARELDCYLEPDATTLLGHLQHDFLDLRDQSEPSAPKVTVSDDDHSIQFHSCYSRLREVQVLHDRLLDLFQDDPSLTPADILIMAPEVEAYAAAIRAVFNSSGHEKFIPWSIADRAVRAEQPLVESFLQLLGLATSRCTAPEVFAILETGPVRRRFQIGDEGLETVRRWIRESGIRWGLDLEHRRQFSPGMTDAHSWPFGISRLFLSYFSGPDAELYRGIAPCGAMTSEDAQLLGNLADFLERLQKSCTALQREQAADEWGVLLLQILDDFFDPLGSEEDEEALTYLRETVCAFVDDSKTAGYASRMSHAVIQAHFSQALSASSGGQAFLSGRVTVCNMVPMRSIPFDVICLLGMNDTDFPRHQKPVSFDMMAATPLPGDRNRRNDDRYLFLEALVSARKVLYLSWVGHDQQDNSERSPSVVVSELLDYVQRGYLPATGDFKSLVAEHPVQPFSPRCFGSSSRSGSYAEQWFPGTEPVAGGKTLIQDPLPEIDNGWQQVDTGFLKRFWAHPVRFFLQERLCLRLWEDDVVLPESEPFVTDTLERYGLVSRLVHEHLTDQEEQDWLAGMQAEGVLPHGSFGENVYQDLDRAAKGLEQDLVPLLTGARDPLEVDLQIGDFHLTGWLDSLFTAGCVRFRPAKLKGKDLVQLWLDHLILNCLADAGGEPVSYHVATDMMVRLGSVAQPREELHRLLQLYRQGLLEPLHFFPETSWAWAEAKEDKRDQKAAVSWNGAYMKKGESEDTAYQIALRGREPLDERFKRLSATVFTPLLACLEN